MIEIRDGFFETNSSSIHALIISKESEDKLPKTVDLSADNPIGDVVRGFVRDLDDNNSKAFINWLYLNGVKTIKYNGSNVFIVRYIEQYKDHPQDFGLPEMPDWNTWTAGCFINLLTGNYEDYIGRDDYLDYDSDTHVEYEI